MSAFIDLTGKRFGRLTVIKRVKDRITKSGYHIVRYECICDCGNTVVVNGNSLRMGKTASCGCYRKEVAYNNRKKYNTYDLSGEYGIGYTSNTNEPFYFDTKDYDKIKDYCWHKNDKGYIISGPHKPHGKTIYLHRLVTDCSKGFFVDHIHGEKTRYDNRNSNLRICTHAENKRNVNIQSNNTSGVTGVTYDKTNCKWLAFIILNQKQIHLGRFNSFEDAVKARKEAENKYFGEYSYDNSQAS